MDFVKLTKRFLLLGLVATLSFVGGAHSEQAIRSRDAIFHPESADSGMVVSEEETAARIGGEILKKGGNAVDAAAAVGFALAVTLPKAGNLGGGGFMLFYDAKTRRTVAIDYRETAPAAAHRDMFLDGEGAVDKEKIRFGHQSAGVPGTVAGLAFALARYGTLSLQQVMAPAVRLAEEGIAVSSQLARDLERRRESLGRWPASRRIFLKPGGEPYSRGERLVQKDLAWSLRQIAEQGPRAFYEGEVAERLVADMKAHGGLITMEDLGNYRALEREPVRGFYRGFEIVSMPPPSSGGVHLIQLLSVLEGYPMERLGHNSAASIHLVAEAMKLAYADRSRYLGDPDFWQVPTRGLVSKAYATELRAKIDADRARGSNEIGPGNPMPHESSETTHYSIMDRHGNVVSNTYTLNFSFGSAIVAAGTGILLNNEMDDFSAKAGVPNAFGLLGGDANAIAPGKRPLSSMTPTLVFKDGAPLLATGTPGGSRIITTILQTIMNVLDYGMNIAAATNASRVHHQWMPDELRVEVGLSPDTLRLLREKGHKVVLKSAMGSTQSIMRINGRLFGATDPRRPGGAALGY